MTIYTHKKKEVLDRIERIDISNYVTQGIFELRRKGYVFDMRNPLELDRLRDMLNDSKNTMFKSTVDFNEGLPFWHEQKVDFIRSNLGKGAVFYFRCNQCHKRVKYLYEYSMCYSPLCRTCCRLGYTVPTRKGRGLSRMLRKPYLSSDDKQWIIKYAGIIKEDFN
jgi:hypothetical protein